MFVRIANRKDREQTASSDLGLQCLSRHISGLTLATMANGRVSPVFSRLEPGLELVFKILDYVTYFEFSLIS